MKIIISIILSAMVGIAHSSESPASMPKPKERWMQTKAVVSFLHRFRMEEGRYPKSWKELSMFLDGNCDFAQLQLECPIYLTGYRFPDAICDILIDDGTLRVILMQCVPDVSSGAKGEVASREVLISPIGDGTEIRRCSESDLDKLFAKVNLKIEDYTGPNGKWEPETELQAILRDRSEESALRDKGWTRDDSIEKTNTPKGYAVVILAVATATIIVLSIFALKRRRR